jgi:hypothetical protein
MTITLYAANDNQFVITGVTDATGTPITGATLTGTLSTPTGTVITTVTFSDVSGQPGNYQGSILAASLPAIGSYVLVVAGTASGITFSAKATVKVATRTF